MTNEKKQILWVDDEIEFLRAHIMFLEEHDYSVSKATNGNDAIELVREKHFDLVFLDEQMPGKDGLTTLEEIKEINSSLPVVFVTKSEEEKLMEDAMGRNINGYLTKPVNPSQILSICKSILYSKSIKKTHFTSTYVNEYAKFKAKLTSNPNPSVWSGLCKSLFKWDINIQSIKDQGLEESHQKHKEEASKQFIKFVEQSFLSWQSNRTKAPFLSYHSLDRKLFPLLKNNKKVCLIVMAGLRMDQWLTMREVLQDEFSMDESIAWAPIPSDRLHSRSALLAGKNAREIALNFPELWQKIEDEDEYRNYEKELLKMNLATKGFSHIDQPSIQYIRSLKDSKEFLTNINDYNEEPLITLVVEFAELLMNLRRESSLLMEIAPTEVGFRELTKIWFKSSNLLKALQLFSLKDRHIVLTSDHGSVLVRQPVEVFCQEERSPHPRVKKGKDISCDERHVFFIESPKHFGLPGEEGEVGYAIAKEDYYFTYPNKFQYFGSRFKNQMVSGGLSIDEIIVPLITMTPKKRL